MVWKQYLIREKRSADRNAGIQPKSRRTAAAVWCGICGDQSDLSVTAASGQTETAVLGKLYLGGDDQRQRRGDALCRHAAGWVDLRSLLHLRFAAIGKGTAQALADHGIFVDCVPEHFDSRSLAEALIPELTENDRVLLLRAENGSVLLPQLLEQAGKAFDNVPLYTVKTDRRKQELLRQELERTDYVFLASASAARAFAEMTGEISYSAEVVAIGDATAKAAAAAEISVTHIAAQADIDGMIQCICKEEV